MANSKGRPPANVFLSHKRRRPDDRRVLAEVGKKYVAGPLLEAQRALHLGRHKTWGNDPKYRVRLKSFRYREEGNPDWEYWRAAEMAMSVMGRWEPERRFRKTLPLDVEAMRLLLWCRREVARNGGARGGRKPNPEAIFKTALSALVAKKLIQPYGGNYLVLPSAREISQVWYVLFGEKESSEAIRGRLRRTGQFCERYESDKELKSVSGKTTRKFGSLGGAILRRGKW
jgi:hypothetical protein